MTTPTSTSSTASDLRGSILEVLPVLLAEGRTEEVLAAVRELVSRNETLERQLAKIRGGSKSNEGVSRDQLALFLDHLNRTQQELQDAEGEQPAHEQARKDVDARLMARAEAAAERAKQKVFAEAENPKRKPLKKPLPPELPRRDNPIDVPESERSCETCGRPRTICGRDISEVLQFKPAELYVRRDIRIKRVCRECEGELVRAPCGDKVVPGGQIGCSVAAQIVYEKYDLGIPLNRQRRNFARMGMPLSTSTLCDQVKWATELLRPLWLVAVEQVLEAKVMHIDGTGLKVVDRDHPDGKRLGTLWATIGANEAGVPVAAYHYASTKKATGQRGGELGPTDILALRSGIVVADADTLFKSQMKRKDVTDCGCNMHARRYFIKALDGGDERAALVVGAFKGLYQVEEDARHLSADERLKLRSERSTPIYEDIVAWCQHYELDTPPKSPLGRAIGYLLRHEEALRRFEHDGSIPIDNMEAEHAFISVALTRKNFLFLGHDNGGDRAAIVYTMLRCCRLAGVDPIEYLTDVLTQLSRKVRRIDSAELMPAKWAESRRSEGTPKPESGRPP